MKKGTIVCVNFISGDLIIGRFVKQDKKHLTINFPVKISNNMGGEKMLMFIRQNLLGDKNTVEYRAPTVMSMYPVADYVITFYNKACKYLSMTMQKSVREEFEMYSKIIDKTTAKAAKDTDISSMIEEGLKEVGDILEPKKKNTLH